VLAYEQSSTPVLLHLSPQVPVGEVLDAVNTQLSAAIIFAAKVSVTGCTAPPQIGDTSEHGVITYSWAGIAPVTLLDPVNNRTIPAIATIATTPNTAKA
jgi:hypothetical protein